MSWFNNSTQEARKSTHESSSVEVQAHKKATKKVVAGVKKASDAFNQTFDNNHFTLTIWLAAGGRATQRLTTKIPGEKKKTWKRTN